MKPKIFSDIPGIGRVYQCPSCEDLHLAIGPMDLRLSKEAFNGLMDLVNKAAAQMQENDFPPVSRGIFWNASRWSLC